MERVDSDEQDDGSAGNDVSEKGDASANHEDFHSSTSSSSLSWQQWVPMENDLFAAVRQVQLSMLQKIDEMLTKNNVPYWLCGGTLMGAIRHGGFIPHDDDVDIECYGHDFEKIARIPIEPPFYTGFQAQCGTWEGHPVGKLKFCCGEFEVDVFQREADLPKRKHFPSKEEVLPLKRYKFHNIEVWGPGNPREYLDRCYGKSWHSEVLVWNHDFNWYHGAWFDPQKVSLPLSEYNAIVTAAGVRPPAAEESAAESYQAFCKDYGAGFYEQYSKYRSQRVFRRNRAAAEWRESQSSNELE